MSGFAIEAELGRLKEAHPSITDERIAVLALAELGETRALVDRLARALSDIENPVFGDPVKTGSYGSYVWAVEHVAGLDDADA